MRLKAQSTLRVIAVVAACWAIAASVIFRKLPDTSALSIILKARHVPLVIAAAAGLIAWALSLARTPEELGSAAPVRTRRFVGLLTLLVITLNLLLLAQPAPPAGLETCQFVKPIGGGFLHFLNCDSEEYMELAKEPSRIWRQSVLQGRPMSFAIPWLISQPLRLVPRLQTAGPYRFGPQFVAYLLVNLGALLLAMLCFKWLLETATGARAGIELLVSFVALAANDVTKLFFWTPHTQIFSLFVPCLTMFVCFRVLTRGKPLPPMHACLLGLGFGAGLLVYGLFVVPALAVAAIHVLAYRRVWPAVLVMIGVFLPMACWVAVVYGLLGTFYNHEVRTYRHYVWMIDCAKAGVASCGPVLRNNLLTFFNTAAPVLLAPLVLLLGGYLARAGWSGETRPAPPAAALSRAVAYTLVPNVLFLAFMGAYAPRLCWQFVPPVLLLAAVEFAALRRSRPHVSTPRMNVAVAGLCIVYVVVLASRQGPYN